MQCSGAGSSPRRPTTCASCAPRLPRRLPSWARDIVQEHRARKAAERVAEKREAVEAAFRAHHEAVTAHRRAALNAPQMGHMANRDGEWFRLRDPRRLTQIVSTPEQRLIAAMQRNRAEEARISAAAIGPRLAPENAAPIPLCGLETA